MHFCSAFSSRGLTSPSAPRPSICWLPDCLSYNGVGKEYVSWRWTYRDESQVLLDSEKLAAMHMANMLPRENCLYITFFLLLLLSPFTQPLNVKHVHIQLIVVASRNQMLLSVWDFVTRPLLPEQSISSWHFQTVKRFSCFSEITKMKQTEPLTQFSESMEYID